MNKPAWTGCRCDGPTAQASLVHPAIDGPFRNSELHGQFRNGPFIRLASHLGGPQPTRCSLGIGGVKKVADHGSAERITALGRPPAFTVQDGRDFGAVMPGVA